MSRGLWVNKEKDGGASAMMEKKAAKTPIERVRGLIIPIIQDIRPCKNCKTYDLHGNSCFAESSDNCSKLDQILAIPGLCIKADDQSLPAIVELESPYSTDTKRCYDYYSSGWQNGQQKMLAADFRKIAK